MKKLLTVLAVLAFTATGFAAEIDPEITGQAWFRYEGNDNTTDFDGDLSDSAEWSEYLIRLNLDFDLTDNVRLYVSPQFWGVAGAGSSTGGATPLAGFGWQNANSDDLQLFEGYLQVTDLGGVVDLTVGRQALNFGNGFIIGNTDFYGGQAFDGVRIDFNVGEGAISVFDMKLREGDGATLTTSSADDASLYGAYGAWNVLDGHEFDAYAMLWRDRLGMGTGTLSLITVGARFTKPADDGGLDYSVEAAFQSGEWDESAPGVGDEMDQGGFGVEGWVGYTLDNGLRVAFKAAYFSGDDDLSEGSGFLNPGSSYYARYGRYDYLYGYWMSNVGGMIGSLTLDYNVNDNWAVGGAVTYFGVAEDMGVDSSTLAIGADGYVKYTHNEHLSWLVSASYLSPDEDWLGEDAAYRGYIHAQINW